MNKSSFWVSTEIYVDLDIRSVMLLMCSMTMILSALSQSRILWELVYCLKIASVRSINTVSWSPLPIAGRTLHLSTMVGYDVKRRSRVLLPRVEKWTFWSNARSLCVFTNALFICIGIIDQFTLPDPQLMSGKLKSPPNRTYEDLFDLGQIWRLWSMPLCSRHLFCWVGDMQLKSFWASRSK